MIQNAALKSLLDARRMAKIALVANGVGLLAAGEAQAATTIDGAAAHAHAANAGWISFIPHRPGSGDGVIVGDYYLSGLAYSANVGWILLGGGSPANGYRYTNAGADHGVNHDGAGNLSGYAWSANTGWINFGWASSNNTFRPRFNLVTGHFSGYGWSGNLGWINLAGLRTLYLQVVDTDADGLSDAWEYEQFGDLEMAGVGTDFDGDGMSDELEYLAGTIPMVPGDWPRITYHALNDTRTEASMTFTSRPNRLYKVQYSTDLGQTDDWDDWDQGLIIGDNSLTDISFAIPSEDRIFFRVQSLLPLPINQ